MSAPQISVALVTRNRPDSLRRCLKSWRAQSVQPLEIIISDDSDDSVRPEIQQIAKQFEARWFAGPRRGLYANRNQAAAHCRGTHVFSSDDDHEHPVDFLAKCTIALQEDPDSAWCLGEVWTWESVSRGWVAPGQLLMNGASNRPADFSNTWAWADGATLCPRRVFDSGLRFCEDFRFGSSYLEFGCLLHAVGRRIRILSSTGVVHHAEEVGRSFEIPLEQRAATYFSVLMLGRVYQRSGKNLSLLALYFLKQSFRQPVTFGRAFSWALRAARERTRWFRAWQAARHEPGKTV